MDEAVEAAWQAVMSERSRLGAFDLRGAFATDLARAGRYRLAAAGLVLDYSRNLLDDRALVVLLRLAAQCKALESLRAQAAGALANPTEGRAALHTALRDTPAPLQSGVASEVKSARLRMARMADELRSGRWTGWSGQSIGAVVNIGIGGSHLGPCFVADALSHLRTPGLSMHFVSNVDPRDLEDTLEGLDPRRTLFVVASKTFGTLETLENARAARRWLLAAGCPESALTRHLAAVSVNVPRAVDFGVAAQNVLPMWDWVGGRFSVWSAIGLPLALGFGMETFEALLAGARAMDAHALEAEAEGNMPLLLALLSVWYRNAWGFDSQAVIPYDQCLTRLPEFLQQLVMESNGKSVDLEG
ncbi:MAG: glucose-6-phosphate isomerase, partial [Gammaproteobacteria bacterium]